MSSVLEAYKAKKAAALAAGFAAPATNAPEAETKLATVTQAEVDGAKQGPDPIKGVAPAAAAVTPASSSDGSAAPELTRGQKAAATRAANSKGKTQSGADPGFVMLADASDRDLVAELFSRGYGVTRL